jgi:hypothetical protein
MSAAVDQFLKTNGDAVGRVGPAAGEHTGAVSGCQMTI